jgi:hypothetical protein
LNFGNPLEDRVPGQPFSYSDHNAVMLELKLKPTNPKGDLKVRQPSRDESFDTTVVQAIKVCQEAMDTITNSKRLYLTSGGLLFMFLLGTVGLWPHRVIYDLIKLVMTVISFYCLLMGTLWNKIEMNSLKAGLNGLENFNKTKIERNGTPDEESKEV